MRIGLGCVALGSHGQRRVSDDIALVRNALDLGVTVFDTADVYGSGASEHVLGRALRGRRDDVVVATKGGFVFRPRRPVEQWGRRQAKQVMARRRTTAPGSGTGSRAGSYDRQDFTPRHLRRAVQASLRRLGTDRIDVYQLHSPEVVRPELIEQLVDLVAVGDVVRFGIGAGSVAEADGWIGVNGVEVVQVPFGVLDPDAGATTLGLARRHHVEVWARGVLGGGLLSLAGRGDGALEAHAQASQIEAIGRLAAESGLDHYELALGFVRSRDRDLSTVLVGTTSRAHLQRNVDALNRPPLPDDVLRALAELSTEGST